MQAFTGPHPTVSTVRRPTPGLTGGTSALTGPPPRLAWSPNICMFCTQVFMNYTNVRGTYTITKENCTQTLTGHAPAFTGPTQSCANISEHMHTKWGRGLLWHGYAKQAEKKIGSWCRCQLYSIHLHLRWGVGDTGEPSPQGSNTEDPPGGVSPAKGRAVLLVRADWGGKAMDDGCWWLSVGIYVDCWRDSTAHTPVINVNKHLT